MKNESEIKEIVEQAHMAGQKEAGLDPSYSSAQVYYGSICKEVMDMHDNIYSDGYKDGESEDATIVITKEATP